MAFRFRRTVSIFPGVRLNLGKRGVSVSAGVRGANVTLGRNGLYGNAGIPGTGMSYREKLFKPTNGAGEGASRDTRSAGRAPALSPIAEKIAQVQLNPETGDITILDANGNDLGDEAMEVAKTYAREDLEHTVQQHVDNHNRMMAQISAIHLGTPPPHAFPSFVPSPFELTEPKPPTLRKLDWLAYLCPARRRAFTDSNARKRNKYQQLREQWQSEKLSFERLESERESLCKKARLGDIAAMESVLDDRLQDIDWPRETELSFELTEDGKTLMLDVDLPEIEDFPTTELRTYKRGVGVSVNELSDTASRKLYMGNVHGMGIRLIGECFACAPSVGRVILSAFTQVPDAATGGIEDKYLYSVKVSREAWDRIHFGNLEAVDPVEVLAAFDLRRDMTKTGIFRVIEPW